MISDEALAKIFEEHAANYKTVVVDAFLINESNDSILLQKRSPDRRQFPNFWDAVGGHLESRETLREALAREIEEESKMILQRVLALTHVFEWPEDSQVIC